MRRYTERDAKKIPAEIFAGNSYQQIFGENLPAPYRNNSQEGVVEKQNFRCKPKIGQEFETAISNPPAK